MKLLQKEVAVILGVDTTTINNWERNRCKPRLYLLPKIVQFLGYNPCPVAENPSIPEAIKAYRLMHGLSQKKLAKVLRIDPTTLARWEKGTSKPGAALRKRLAELLGSRGSIAREILEYLLIELKVKSGREKDCFRRRASPRALNLRCSSREAPS